MSHIDAPLRSRRHSDPSPANSNKVRRRQPAPRSANDTHDYAPDALLFPTLLLPAELELRRVAARPDSVLLRSARPAGPRHYATDSSFRLHALVARQSSSSGARTTYAAALDDALEDVDASTDCGAVAAAYRGSASTPQVVALCTRRRRAVIRATQAEASASSSRAAASTSRAVASASSRSSRAAAASSSSRAAAAAAASSSSSSSASSSRSAAAAATRTRTRLIQRTTRPANTPRIAAPITTPLNPSQASASRFSELESFVSSQFDDAASVITSRAAAASSSREALQSSVDSLFSSALVVVSSRRASATASSTAQVSASSSATTPTSTSTSLPPSSSSSTSADPSSTSSGAEPSATAAPASGNRIAKIVGPSVAIPLGLLLLGLLAFCLLRRRRRRRNAAGPLGGRSTPGGLGPISNPQPMQAAPQQYGAMARFAPGAGSGSGMGGVGVGAGVGAAAAAGAGGAAAVGAARGNNDSQESVGTTPSAIGVAFSEPRTKWGRRSLVDVLAGGVRSANSGSNSPSGSGAGTGFGTPERQFRGVSGTSSFGGRQPSITSLASGSIPSEYRGVGGYNSFGYQPGQMRPVMTPLGGHYDPFAPSPSIVPVPASAQRHPYPVPSEEGSISGYGSGSGSHSGSGSGDDLARQYGGAAPAGERATFGDGAAAQPGLPYLAPLRPDMGRSRTTGTTTTGEEGYYTADPGASSRDELESETLEEVVLRDFGVEDYSPEERSVNFGSGSSGSGGSGSAGRPSFVGSVRRSFEEPGATPRVGSRTSTPRLGSGHGSLGTRRNDGTGSWWN
ncbi:uncharacterized protein RHOBADRAFT_50846 [Rhodotorula graminis WP1]|uniref:Uncharacterized protein n=1 Tax=Rhodotorula graminis (strain WP1) TaxID=578459 RepID=A0A194SCB4_RHOGW|nr:uncharacterized protein RHOBADRAFT_50846 [Rhodotorula graminis WP1]KPV78373.1 hypothetical protein RHOBADRAFT_50846 [Rhodotorula graminis WP1]